MGRLERFSDKEEVPGSNPGAPTSHLQGNRVPHSLRRRPFATILQPKCVRLVGTKRESMGVVGTDAMFAGRGQAGASSRHPRAVRVPFTMRLSPWAIAARPLAEIRRD